MRESEKIKISGYSMNQLAIRLDDRQDYLTLINSSLIQDTDIVSIWCIRHKGKNQDNPHYHFAIETKLRSDTFMARFKQIFTKGSGNSHHSRKKWDGKNRYIQYTLKEVKEINLLQDTLVLNITRHITGEWVPWYSTDAVSRLLALAITETEDILDNTPAKVCTRIIRQILASDDHKYPTRKSIFARIFRYYQEKGDWMPNKHQYDRYIVYIMVKVAEINDNNTGSTEIEDLIDTLYNEYYRQY